MEEVILGKDLYKIHQPLIDWCREELGVGGWKYLCSEDWNWTVEIVFGNTIFQFKNEDLKKKFLNYPKTLGT